MRIIAGKAKGQNLIRENTKQVRPTTDRVKEALFNILGKAVPESTVLDLFAGFGSLGLEALSRGAKKAVFIEKRHNNTSIIKKNLKICRLNNRSTVKTMDVFKYLKNPDDINFNLIFMDPPYQNKLGSKVLSILADSDKINENTLIVLECHKNENINPSEKFKQIREKIYGDTRLNIYLKQEA